MGLKPDEFYAMTSEDFYYAHYGYLVREARQWERVRYQAWLFWNANCDQASRKMKPELLFPLITDKVRKIDAKTMAERYRKAKEGEIRLNQWLKERGSRKP